jgi:hypothetical protein
VGIDCAAATHGAIDTIEPISQRTLLHGVRITLPFIIVAFGEVTVFTMHRKAGCLRRWLKKIGENAMRQLAEKSTELLNYFRFRLNLSFQGVADYERLERCRA